MTTLLETIEQQWKAAMKDKASVKDVLSSIRSEVKNKWIEVRSNIPQEERSQPTDQVVLDTLKKMAKQRRESVEEYKKGGRQDLVDKETFELSVVESFLPKQLSSEETLSIISEVVKETDSKSISDFGKVMKFAMAKIAGRADGKEVQAAVKKALGA